MNEDDYIFVISSIDRRTNEKNLIESFSNFSDAMDFYEYAKKFCSLNKLILEAVHTNANFRKSDFDIFDYRYIR